MKNTILVSGAGSGIGRARKKQRPSILEILGLSFKNYHGFATNRSVFA